MLKMLTPVETALDDRNELMLGWVVVILLSDYKEVHVFREEAKNFTSSP